MLKCRQATQLLSEQLDHPLQFSEHTQLTLHLCVCRSCRRYSQHISAIRQLCKNYLKIQPPEAEKP